MTTLAQLEAWAALGESETQELKRTTGQRSEACRALCGMLNHNGGRVVFGITAQGAVVGQQVSDKTIEDLVAEIQTIEPPVFPALERVPVASGLEALVVSVGQGAGRPYSIRGRAYRRVGNTTLEMTRDEHNRMLLEQLHGTRRWENESADGWSVDDLDSAEVVRTLEEAIRRGRAEDPNTRDPSEILRGLGLVSRDGQLLRAAVVLFGRGERLTGEYPQCLLRVARFRGTDKTEFLDNRRFVGNAFDLLQRAERFLVENLPVAGRITPGQLARIDTPLYPTEALREALANAFCHRDYSIGGGSVGVAVFDDRLEITSSGGLHFGLTVEDLYRPHESLPWNPLVAGVLYRRGIIEAWGRGTLKMVELMRQAGLPRPDIEAVSGAVTVRFLPDRYVAPQRVGHDLSARQRAILQLLGEGARPSAGEIHRAVDPDALRTRTRDDLRFLRRLGLVDYAGTGRGARWFLNGVRE